MLEERYGGYKVEIKKMPLVWKQKKEASRTRNVSQKPPIIFHYVGYAVIRLSSRHHLYVRIKRISDGLHGVKSYGISTLLDA